MGCDGNAESHFENLQKSSRTLKVYGKVFWFCFLALKVEYQLTHYILDIGVLSNEKVTFIQPLALSFVEVIANKRDILHPKTPWKS